MFLSLSLAMFSFNLFFSSSSSSAFTNRPLYFRWPLTDVKLCWFLKECTTPFHLLGRLIRWEALAQKKRYRQFVRGEKKTSIQIETIVWMKVQYDSRQISFQGENFRNLRFYQKNQNGSNLSIGIFWFARKWMCFLSFLTILLWFLSIE